MAVPRRMKRSEVPTGTETQRRAQAAPANTGSHLARGARARQQARQVADEASSSGNSAWRFWLPNDDSIDEKTITDSYPDGLPKNECEVIMLDETLDDIVGMYEHNLKIGGKWGHFEACPREWDNCPICENGDRSYYVVFFSILVLRPWTSKDGKKSGEWTKMLLPVKSAQLSKFEELCQASQKKNGKLRGTSFVMRRDVANQQSPSIGEPTVLEGGVMFDFYDEAALVEEFGNAAEKSRDGKLVKPENEDITPYVYEELFKKPSAADLRKRFGGGVQAGSKEDVADEWGEGQTASTRTAQRRRPAVKEDAVTEDAPVDDNDNLPY